MVYNIPKNRYFLLLSLQILSEFRRTVILTLNKTMKIRFEFQKPFFLFILPIE